MTQTFLLWLWIGLSLASITVLGLILKSLYNRMMSAAHQLQRMSGKLEALAKALEDKPVLSAPENSILVDQAAVAARRKLLVKARIKKDQLRQRRLIASLKRFDPNESRFN